MATVKDALDIARSLLNDDLGTVWPDAVLLPKIKIAHRELQAKLLLNSIPVIKSQSAIIPVPAGSTDLGTNQPPDLVEPISMKERAPGGSMDDFEDMFEVPFIPQIQPDSNLIYWAWIGEKIRFLGATTDREVLLRYSRSLTVPSTINDDIGFLFGELYLGTRVASMCSERPDLKMQAESLLEDIVRTNVKGMQGVVRRRLPYRHRRRRRIGVL